MYKLLVQAFNKENTSRHAELSTFTRLVTVEKVKLVDVERIFLFHYWNSTMGALEYFFTVIEHENTALNIVTYGININPKFMLF